MMYRPTLRPVAPAGGTERPAALRRSVRDQQMPGMGSAKSQRKVVPLHPHLADFNGAEGCCLSVSTEEMSGYSALNAATIPAGHLPVDGDGRRHGQRCYVYAVDADDERYQEPDRREQPDPGTSTALGGARQ